MAFNYIWLGLFLVAFVAAAVSAFVGGDWQVFQRLVQSTFDSAKTSVEVSVYLIGVISLWQGIMKVGQDGGAIALLTRVVEPFFGKLFPALPKGHPAFGSMMMNFSANMLGLDNAATPLGLKAMRELQEANQQKDEASDAMIAFAVLNTSGLTLVPVSIMAMRAANGAANPSDVFLPILIATYFSTLTGLIAVCLKQRISLLQPALLATLTLVTSAVVLAVWVLSTLTHDQIALVSSVFGNGLILAIIATFLALAFRRKLNVYQSFVDGAKDGFNVAISILPYLVAMLVAVALLRASGALDFVLNAFIQLAHLPADLAQALPTALMKPLSGSGARGFMVEAMQLHGADSFTGRLACVFQGSTETTFYVLAVYFGSVGIVKTRYALPLGLLADAAGIAAAIVVSYIFFV